jgi:hypothetical protein
MTVDFDGVFAAGGTLVSAAGAIALRDFLVVIWVFLAAADCRTTQSPDWRRQRGS